MHEDTEELILKALKQIVEDISFMRKQLEKAIEKEEKGE